MPEPDKSPWWRNEDWVAVGAGLLTLGAVLAGLRILPPKFAWSNAASLENVVAPGPTLWASAHIGLACFLLAAAGHVLTRGRVGPFLAGFPAVYALGWLSLVLAGNAAVGAWGLEYVLFALAFGLVISNLLGVPGWLREAARTELYIKTGLVILGAGILFQDILGEGKRGMAQALLVVTAVWFFAYWLARRLRVDDELGVMLSTAVSICGVSAAIAACGAIQGDRKKLSYVTSLVLVVAVPMMVAMPWIVKAAGIPERVGGAWIGGTLDTSPTVTAAALMVSEQAGKTGVIVKLSQNVLIGVAAFLLSIWWSVRGGGPRGARPSARVIWERFPKFVLGFLAASLLFTALREVSPDAVKGTKDLLKALQTAWFALAFVSIGLETRFGELVTLEGGRPALAFIGAQAFNVAWTLVWAYVFFG